jgi:hypothetical protein
MTLRHHPAADAIKDLLRPAVTPAAAPAAVLDDAKKKAEEEEAAAKLAAEEEAAKKAAEEKKKAEEPVMDAAGNYQDGDIALKAVAAVQEWAETPPSDLDEGEGSGDRLFSLLAGIADSDMDGEISEAEAEVVNMAANAAADYLVAKGVPEDDAVALLQDFDNGLADSVQELVLNSLPEGDEAAAAEIDEFVFGDGSDESALDSTTSNGEEHTYNGVTFDSAVFGVLTQKPNWMRMTAEQLEQFKADPATLDAVYKKKIVIRRGKKVRINKRVSGTVRLTAKQKVAVRKMLRKTHSAVAQMRRSKSMRVRRRAGL